MTEDDFWNIIERGRRASLLSVTLALQLNSGCHAPSDRATNPSFAIGAGQSNRASSAEPGIDTCGYSVRWSKTIKDSPEHPVLFLGITRTQEPVFLREARAVTVFDTQGVERTLTHVDQKWGAAIGGTVSQDRVVVCGELDGGFVVGAFSSSGNLVWRRRVPERDNPAEPIKGRLISPSLASLDSGVVAIASIVVGPARLGDKTVGYGETATLVVSLGGDGAYLGFSSWPGPVLSDPTIEAGAAGFLLGQRRTACGDGTACFRVEALDPELSLLWRTELGGVARATLKSSTDGGAYLLASPDPGLTLESGAGIARVGVSKISSRGILQWSTRLCEGRSGVGGIVAAASEGVLVLYRCQATTGARGENRLALLSARDGAVRSDLGAGTGTVRLPHGTLLSNTIFLASEPNDTAMPQGSPRETRWSYGSFDCE